MRILLIEMEHPQETQQPILDCDIGRCCANEADFFSATIMKFIPTAFHGLFVVDAEKREDTRGFFARTYCVNEFRTHGITEVPVQNSISMSYRRGTLRGLHFQKKPFEEAKIVTCLSGSLWDVAVDLRPESKTFGKYFSLELTAADGMSIYVPQGFAHGFQTLADNTIISYQMTAAYIAELQDGLRWDDPTLAITWPLTPTVVSDRDLSHPNFAGKNFLLR